LAPQHDTSNKKVEPSVTVVAPQAEAWEDDKQIEPETKGALWSLFGRNKKTPNSGWINKG